MSQFEEYIRSYAKYCSIKIDDLTKALKSMPKGRLAAYKYKNFVRYKHIIKGQKAKNISKKDTVKLQELAQKNVHLASLSDYKADYKICLQTISKFEKHPHSMDALLSDPNICCLLTQISAETDIQAWISAEYKHYQSFSEQLIIPTEAGIYVRSKSEALIVSAMLDLNIPFRYEEELVMGGVIVHPDFTILRPRDRKLIYLEHFGMMDDTDYAYKTGRKLQQYIEHGYIPYIDLICFFETKKDPLNISLVKSVLAELIL